MEIIEDPATSLWWSVAEDCEYATFHHTPAWAQIAADTFGDYSVAPLAATLSNGTRVVLPLVSSQSRVKKFNISKKLIQLQSTYTGAYGDVIADGPVTEEVAGLYSVARSKEDLLNVVGNPSRENHDVTKAGMGKDATKTEDFTHVIRLDADFTSLSTEFNSDSRRRWRRARENGASRRLLTTIEEYEEYFAAYQNSLDRWGDEATTAYPWSLFETIFEYSQEYGDHIKLWATIVNGEIASGKILFYWNNHAIYWHGASNSEFFDYNPNDFLEIELVKEMAEANLEYYDLGPSAGLKGVIKYKEKFATDKWHFPRWTYASPKIRYIRRALNTNPF